MTHSLRRWIVLVPVALLLAVFGIAGASGVVELLQVNTYGGTQDEGVGVASVTLTGNSWKQTPFTYTITPDTVLDFDFDGAEGEVNGIGFDTDDTMSGGTIFRVWGTQDWGIGDYEAGPGHYVIPVGQHFTGTFDRMVFVNDDDAGVPSGVSEFSNVRVYENVPATTTTTQPTTTTTSPDLNLTADLVLTADDTRSNFHIEGNGFSIMVDGADLAWSDFTINNVGRIMWMNQCGVSTLTNGVISDSGTGEIDFYPLHWHLCEDTTRGTVVDNVTVLRSRNRGFVPHLSDGISLLNVKCQEVIGECLWWNKGGAEHDPHDLLVDGAYADTIYSPQNPPPWGGTINDGNHHRNSAFLLRGGTGHVIRNSTALNVQGGQDCSGFHWPEQGGSSSSWTFENNHVVPGDCHSVFIWQQTAITNPITGLTGAGLEMGAYKSGFAVNNANVEYTFVHALGWTMNDSHAGVVRTRPHNSIAEGLTVTFTNTTFDLFEIKNGSGQTAGTYIINGGNLICADILWTDVYPGTTVTIDGVGC